MIGGEIGRIDVSVAQVDITSAIGSIKIKFALSYRGVDAENSLYMRNH